MNPSNSISKPPATEAVEEPADAMGMNQLWMQYQIDSDKVMKCPMTDKCARTANVDTGFQSTTPLPPVDPFSPLSAQTLSPLSSTPRCSRGFDLKNPYGLTTSTSDAMGMNQLWMQYQIDSDKVMKCPMTDKCARTANVDTGFQSTTPLPPVDPFSPLPAQTLSPLSSTPRCSRGFDLKNPYGLTTSTSVSKSGQTYTSSLSFYTPTPDAFPNFAVTGPKTPSADIPPAAVITNEYPLLQDNCLPKVELDSELASDHPDTQKVKANDTTSNDVDDTPQSCNLKKPNEKSIALLKKYYFSSNTTEPSDQGPVVESQKPAVRTNRWTPEEDFRLKSAVEAQQLIFSSKSNSMLSTKKNMKVKIDWKKISTTEFHDLRSSTQCRNRWLKVISPELNREKWTKKEDDFILDFVKKSLANSNPTLRGKFSKNKVDWSMLARSLPNGFRTVDQVRGRYENVLDPALKPQGTRWSEDEIKNLVDARQMHGNQWRVIATYIPGRSALQCKNKFYNTK